MIDISKHDWVQYKDQVGVIIRNDFCGGVFRGHYDVFFGEVKNGSPVLKQIFGGYLTKIEAPKDYPFDVSLVTNVSLSELPLGETQYE